MIWKYFLLILQGDLYVNGDSKLVERDVVFNGGVAFGVDKALIPLGFGGNCDVIKETQITVTNHNYCDCPCYGIANLYLASIQSTNPLMSLTHEKYFFFSFIGSVWKLFCSC